jgi:isocitrate/isopropylmalate dehydrogenase
MKRIAVTAGDGIGEEVMPEGVRACDREDPLTPHHA